ncbi:MAG: hypothetical protein JXA11_13945 [Phycisphaerae bacterium]|nr:hypothetical protein [Phycisphaerae bacterium]
MSVGRSSTVSSFQAYSAGASSYGNLYQAPEGGGALRSSMQNINTYKARSGNPASAFGGGASALKFGKSTKNIAGGAVQTPGFNDPAPALPSAGGRAPVLAGSGAAPSLDRQTPSSLEDAGSLVTFTMPAEDSGQAYAAALGNSQADEKKEKEESITTLVPTHGGSRHYRRLIREGEEAFRKEDYKKAARAFGIAAEISSRSSESQLSLMHVHFATSINEYNLPSLYLQRVLKDLPELPLIPVHPRNFYGNVGAFVEDVIQLEEYVKRNPEDAHAHLILAYMKWRQEQPNQAVAALRRAWEHRKNNQELSDAVQTFWKGLVYSGAVSGKLTDAPVETGTESLPGILPTPIPPPGISE